MVFEVFEDREPTVQEVIFALRCGGCGKDCDECYYGTDRACRACQDAAKRDAADMLLKVKVAV